MTETHTEERSPPGAIEPIVDHETLRDREDILYHDNTDTVDSEIVAQVAELGDLAAAGITNPDGELLFRRATDTCSWKVPVATVAPEEDFAGELRTHVRESIGFTLSLDDIVGVWDSTVQTEDGAQTASRAFVTFSATSKSGTYDLADTTAEGEGVEEAGWFSSPPEEADLIPGTEEFLD
jgi:hypothetical protein